MTEQSRRRQEKQPPAAPPQPGIGTVNRPQHFRHRGVVTIEIGQPIAGRARVVRAAPLPFLLRHEPARDAADQAVAGHDAAGEEVLGDPILLVVGIEPVRPGAVAEHMQEQPPVGPQPAVNLAQQRVPVGHMLEHLHRHDAVEPRIDAEIVHVGGHDPQVPEPARAGLRLDIRPLRPGVGHRRNPRPGETFRHPQAQRPPAATEFQNILPVRQIGMFGCFRQRPLLGHIQRVVLAPVQAARVFPSCPQNKAEERRRDLVMLRVRRIRAHRDRAFGHGTGERGFLPVGAVRELAACPLHQPGDSGVGDQVRQRHTLDHTGRHGDRAHRSAPLLK